MVLKNRHWFLFALLMLGHEIGLAQLSQGYIYGAVVLKNGERYEGQIRWEDEEALWDDMFNAYRIERPIRNVLTEAEARKIERRTEEFSLDFMELWEDKNPESYYPFRCSFGDLLCLKIVDNKIVQAQLKNGQKIKLRSGRDDLSEDIIIYDYELGQIELNFENIQAIYFKSTPRSLVSQGGKPIYGKILTTLGQFEGFITWDSEECLEHDLIGGRQKGTLLEIGFGNIQELKTQDDGSILQLKSGRRIFLNNHSDVNNKNRGVFIRNLAFGKLEVDWKNFISASFLPPPVAPLSYDDYAQPKRLSGTVTTKTGKQYRGLITYDLDEQFDLEFLNGNNNGFQYYVPFSKIKRLEPQNDKFTLVYLKDDTQLLLGGNADVTGENHGIIIQPRAAEAEYLLWNSVKTIDFE